MRKAAQLVAAMMGLGYGVAFACSCIDRSTPELLDASTAVFLGDAGAASAAGGSSSGCSFVPLLGDEGTEFVVIEAFKGVEVGDTVFVAHGTDGDSCGVAIADGERWLVFAEPNDDGLFTSLCSGSALESDSALALGELRGN
ncbi:MAG: hypothetical protein H0V89_14365 [Deltaproteobacteria bacterium]|nr:hypothetical protein [Deltaproteobacteria bacterium]